MPRAPTPWTASTKDRLIAKSKVDSSPQLERQVSRAVARAKAGDRDAVQFLYTVYADNVYGYVRTIVRDHHDAEDVTQQVFAKLITAISKYREHGIPFVAWLLRVSHNAAVDTVRNRRTTPAEEIFSSEDGACDESSDRVRSLHAAFASLPANQRQVAVLRHVLGLTPLEIAEQLGRSSSSVYGLQHRGQRALCAQLERLETVPRTARSSHLSRAEPVLTGVVTPREGRKPTIGRLR